MTVGAILAEKGRHVITTTGTVSVAAAAIMLAKNRIGALVVVDEAERIVGIVSERDIVRAIAGGGADALTGPVNAIMTRSVVTCGEDESINDAMTRITRGRFRHLPVVAGGRMAGIVSIGDVVKARIEQVEREADELRAYIATA
jgi:CBS domain-containing protein